VVRGAFHRFNARLAPSGAPRTLIKIARCVPHPCAQRESDSLPRPGSGRRVTLVIGRRAPFGVGMRRDKMLLTDFCNQRAIHGPAKRSILRAWGFRRHRPTPRAATLPFGESR